MDVGGGDVSMYKYKYALPGTRVDLSSLPLEVIDVGSADVFRDK